VATIRPSRLKALRKTARLTQAELAQQAGITKEMVYRHEAGRVDPELATVIRYADILNTSTDYLLGRTSSPGAYPRNAAEERALAAFRSKNYPELFKLLANDKPTDQEPPDAQRE
jgi:DNA-binding XRE family transcriptional regulator